MYPCTPFMGQIRSGTVIREEHAGLEILGQSAVDREPDLVGGAPFPFPNHDFR